ncbi:sodium/potassium-transporting ATPase subunit beta-2-like [Paramacrobiotus metropolitanus]|uniref:sodium/potassium-transporting ATPase subunit beta-2-like n=1 Tax=Paramacrobiotus metropolitanus TaxID=2943436 RepID=UPI002445C750|nr:sodium/potassium-transporting ATPase subunit beta-2-like [Paramacrobiotus metropolitanus]
MASKTTEHVTFVGGQPKQAPSKMRDFLNFLYDKSTGKVLGRTGKSWLQITVFYLIFYGVLAAFFAVLLVLFLQTLDTTQPKWVKEQGIIGNKPGMGFRPTPPDTGSSLIWVKTTSGQPTETTQKYIDSLNEYLLAYDANSATHSDGSNIDCTNRRPDEKTKVVCRYPLEKLGPCTKENNYGYKHGQPCVLLKLNKIFGWVPEPYNATDIANKNYPEDLQRYVEKQKITLKPDQLYYTCSGQDSVDKENIGPIRIHPESFSPNFFPYENRPNYLTPVAMVEFLNPQQGVVINVECKAWAKNIEHSRTDKLGQVNFELMVDR